MAALRAGKGCEKDAQRLRPYLGRSGTRNEDSGRMEQALRNPSSAERAEGQRSLKDLAYSDLRSASDTGGMRRDFTSSPSEIACETL